MEIVEEVLDDDTVLRHDGSGVPEVAPPRFDLDDNEGIRRSLKKHGFACIKHAMLPHEVEKGRELLWQFLEGREQPKMRQSRPVGWKEGQPKTWIEGHGDHLMTSTTHIDSMWYCRTRPGVVQGFATAIGTPDLTCACLLRLLVVYFPRLAGVDPRRAGSCNAMPRAH
jgi:hypothetical protein